MSFAFSDVVIETRRGPRRALVMTPQQDHIVGHARLEALRELGEISPTDLALAERIDTATEPYRVVIFRGKNDDESGSWRMDPSLDAAELAELSWRLALSQLSTWRQLIQAGVWVMVHAEFGASAAPFRQGARELINKPVRHATLSPEVADIDEWILRHLVFFFSGSFDNVVTQILPDKLPLVEMRAEKLAGMATTLRAAKLDR